MENRGPLGARRGRASRLAAIGLFAVSSAAWSAVAIPVGKSSFEFVDGKGRADRPIPVHTYRPAGCDAKCPLQFVMAGLHRNAPEYRDYWTDAADRYRVVIVAPEFSAKRWPRAAAYNLGDVAAQVDREKWAFAAIEHLFDEIRDGRADYRIFGHSAGAQFVHRMALFRPDHRAAVMVAANPGWYTMPEWREGAADPFPYSLVQAKIGEPELRRALERRFVLMLGQEDRDPRDPHLKDDAAAQRQGAHRVERGERFFQAAASASRTLGTRFAWELVTVPGVAHSGAAMSRAAAQTLYGNQ